MARGTFGFTLALLLIYAHAAAAQIPKAQNPVPTPAPQPAPKPTPAPSPDSPPNEVPGLKLPAPATISSKRALLHVKADTKAGELSWAVIFVGGYPTEVVEDDEDKSVGIVVPEAGTVIYVTCAGFLDGKAIRPAAVTQFTVKADPTPGPGPGPNPSPNPTPTPNPNPNPNPPVPVAGKLYVTIVEDPALRTPAIGALLNSGTLRKSIADIAGTNLAVYDVRSAVLQPKSATNPTGRNLAKSVQAAGALPCLIVQSSNGAVLAAVPIQGTETDVVAAVRKAAGR
jgi:hypothetical protein